jgi:hypothetical protein
VVLPLDHFVVRVPLRAVFPLDHFVVRIPLRAVLSLVATEKGAVA